jgi:hypothetical protein
MVSSHPSTVIRLSSQLTETKREASVSSGSSGYYAVPVYCITSREEVSLTTLAAIAPEYVSTTTLASGFEPSPSTEKASVQALPPKAPGPSRVPVNLLETGDDVLAPRQKTQGHGGAGGPQTGVRAASPTMADR